MICRRGYVVFPWGLAACVILGSDLLVTLKGACVCDIFLLVGFVEYLSPEEDWLTTTDDQTGQLSQFISPASF